MKKLRVYGLLLVLVVLCVVMYPVVSVNGLSILKKDVILEGMSIEIPNPMVAPESLKLGGSRGAEREEKKCNPCPPCARCPEPSFECKKVPTYSNIKFMDDHVPQVRNNEYTTFGM